jgi:hypothetical protein
MRINAAVVLLEQCTANQATLIFETAREARLMARPGHRADHHAVLWARHPGRVGLHKRARLAHVQRPHRRRPSPRSNPGQRRRQTPAQVALRPARAARHHQLSFVAEGHLFDHHGASPSSRAHTLPWRTPFPLPSLPALEKPET